MVERNHQKLKQFLNINVVAEKPHWDRYVNLAILAHNTTYHQSLKITPTEILRGHIAFPTTLWIPNFAIWCNRLESQSILTLWLTKSTKSTKTQSPTSSKPSRRIKTTTIGKHLRNRWKWAAWTREKRWTSQTALNTLPTIKCVLCHSNTRTKPHWTQAALLARS